MDIILYKDINKKQTCFLIYMIAVLQKKVNMKCITRVKKQKS